jgi:NADPH:quinone reductase-like Zn-dependent oxidoreductase
MPTFFRGTYETCRIRSARNLDTLRLADIEIPVPAPNELLVRVRASSLNYHNYLVATGVVPAAPGRIPMSDGVDEVIHVGTDVTEFSTGQRVMGTYFPDWLDGLPTAENTARMRGDQVNGFASEFVALPSTSFTKVPDNLSNEEAATLPCAGLTAWRALIVEGTIKPGDTVLIEGTGGVSIFALQFARLAGAIVIATSSSEAKLARLRSLGADHTINYLEVPDWGKRVRGLTGGKGVYHVVEVVGGDLSQVMEAVRVGGKIYMIGALSHQAAQFSPMAFILRNVRLIGLTVGSRRHQEEMVRAIQHNGLTPVVDRVFPLEEISRAFKYQEDRTHFGKICLSW